MRLHWLGSDCLYRWSTAALCSAPGEQAWGAKDASRGRGWLVTILLGHSSASCHTPRSLGTLVISLQQLQTAGHLVLQEALVDENLRVSPVSSVSPQPATPKPECPSRQRVPFLRGETQTQTGVVTRPLSQGAFHYSPQAKIRVQL